MFDSIRFLPNPAKKVWYTFTIANGGNLSAAVDLGPYRATYIRPPASLWADPYLGFQSSPDDAVTAAYMAVGHDGGGVLASQGRLLVPVTASQGITLVPWLLRDHRFLKIQSMNSGGSTVNVAGDRVFVIECQYAGY